MQPCARGGWVRSDVWDKVPNKTVFLGTFRKPFNFGDLPDAEIKSDKKTKRRNPLDVNHFHQLGQAENHWSTTRTRVDMMKMV